MLVSFLTPAYNAASTIPSTLASVIAQTHENWEAIVVDDGSTDGTDEAVRRIGDARIKVVRQANAGQSAAVNAAMRLARGDYVVFLDADDLISPNKLAVQLARLEKAPPGSVAFGPWGRFQDDPATTHPVPEPFWRDIDPLTFHCEMWTANSMIQGASYLIPRALAERAGPWREDLSLINDFEFFVRLLLPSPGLVFCPEVMLYYRSGTASVSARKSRAAYESAFRALAGGTATLLAAESSARTRRAASRAWEVFAFEIYPTLPEMQREVEERISALGGPYELPPLGPRIKAVASVIGWKAAKRLRILLSR